MMEDTMRVRRGKEIHFTTPNEVGTVGKVTSAFSQGHLNLLGFCALGTQDTGNFWVYTEDNTKAFDCIKGIGYKPNEEDVLLVEINNQAGAINEAATKLAKEGIDIYHSYCSSHGDMNKALWIVRTNDNERALKVLS